jgi:hypothetical protein
MFGLKAFFDALARLTTSVNRSADLFDAANDKLALQLGFDQEEPAQLEHTNENGNGATPKRRKAAANS